MRLRQSSWSLPCLCLSDTSIAVWRQLHWDRVCPNPRMPLSYIKQLRTHKATSEFDISLGAYSLITLTEDEKGPMLPQPHPQYCLRFSSGSETNPHNSGSSSLWCARHPVVLKSIWVIFRFCVDTLAAHPQIHDWSHAVQSCQTETQPHLEAGSPKTLRRSK